MGEQNPFEYKKPTENSVEDIKEVRSKAEEFYQVLMKLAPSRERSLAITKLEEASMWANKGIVFNQIDKPRE